MSMDLEQSQRRDINTTLNDRITLDIDGEVISSSPFVVDLEEYTGNNWFNQSNKIVKLNLTERDSIVFNNEPIPTMAFKDIKSMIVCFDYEITNVSANYPLLSNISLTCLGMTNYMLVESILTISGHIEVDCSLFNFSSATINTAISEQGFDIGINWNGNKSNATVKLHNVKVKLEFDNQMGIQEDAIVNRLIPHIDLYKEGTNLVLELGDIEGQGGGSHSGSSDTYTKDEINLMLASKVDVVDGKGLSSNDYTLLEKVKLGGIESQANKYVHPSSHSSDMIVESSDLDNLEVSGNANQHEINLAIDSKIGQGGGGSVIGTGSFSIDNNGHLIVELPNGVDNPYSINSQGHLIYDTSRSGD